MKTIYSGMSQSKFRIYSILSCFIGDLLISAFIWYKYSDRAAFEVAFKKVSAIYGSDKFTPELANEIYIIVAQTVALAIVLIILFHMVMYGLFYLNKKSAYWYIKCLVWVGVPGCLLVGIPGIFSGIFSQAILTLQAALYLYVLLGMKQFPFKVKVKN